MGPPPTANMSESTLSFKLKRSTITINIVPTVTCASAVEVRYTFYLLAQYYWHSKLLKSWSKGNNERNIEMVLFVNVMIPSFCCVEL